MYDPRLLAALAQHAQAAPPGMSLQPPAAMPQLGPQFAQAMHQQGTMGAYNQHPQVPGPQPGQYAAPGYAQAHDLAQKQAAVRYAKQRLDQMRRIASQMPSDFQGELSGATQPGADPAAAWREVSAALAKAALAAGYRDPRVFIQDLLARTGGGGPHGHQAV